MQGAEAISKAREMKTLQISKNILHSSEINFRRKWLTNLLS